MATIKDVAKRAGVSISTVSNVLNSSKYVSDELTQKVQAAIADLHYRVDVTARNMKIRNTKMIGVIVSSFHIIFVPQVMNGIQKYASEHLSLIHISGTVRFLFAMKLWKLLLAWLPRYFELPQRPAQIFGSLLLQRYKLLY